MAFEIHLHLGGPSARGHGINLLLINVAHQKHMNDEVRKLEKIRELLSKLPVEFVVIYRGKMTKKGLEFRWCRAVSRAKKTHEQYDQLATMFRDIALHSYQNKQSVILEEVVSRPNSKTKRWCGLNVPVAKNVKSPPTNSIGQRWWELVVEPVTTCGVGYVVVARVAAKEESEVADYIKAIYNAMRD